MGKKQILVVEDEFLSAMELKKKLLELGYDVLAIVKSGEEAVQKAGELSPDLVLMDITLNGHMDGIEAAREIRKFRPIPIVYLTAHADIETLDDAKITEPFGYLPKPCTMNTLSATITMALYKSEVDAARQKAEDALCKSERLYRTVADFTHDWEFWIGPDDDFIYCSLSCERITGHSATAFGQDPSLLRVLVHPEDLIGFDQHYHKATKERQITPEFEFRIIRADGSLVWIAQTCQPVYDDNGQFLGTRGSNRDVTGRKRLEAEVAKDKNLATLGTLANGICNDFNNLFQGHLGNLTLAKMYTEESSKAFHYLEKAEQMYGLSDKLTAKLTTFSADSFSLLSTIQPALHIRKAADLPLDGSGLGAEFDLADNLWPIHVGPSQFYDVLKQMVQNSIEATTLESGGKIKIIATNETLPEGHGQHPILPPGNYVRISIQDQGCGISNENLPRIFDPYFSTKTQFGCNKGVGLGLALCDMIIRKFGGVITAQSQLGKGSTFHIYLPAVAVAPAAHETMLIKDQAAQGPRILLMDDDQDVVLVTTEFLKLSGYRIDVAPDGETAIAAYQEARTEGVPYSVVILDLTIPGGMGGKDAIAILKEIDPEVKAIVSSGYAEDRAMIDFSEYGFVAACAKPYLLSEIKEVIARFV